MITIFQHGPGEPPGYILEIIEEKMLEYEIIRPFDSDRVPERVTSSHYIFLGGLMSVNDEEEYPYLAREKRLIRQAVQSGVPLLGVCLGAQLIASSFSSKVGRCEDEKGWTAIRKCNPSCPGTKGDEISVFEWHGECFELPPGSSLLYTGDRVPNQMFSCGSAIGVQFHPEVTEQIIRQWTDSKDPAARDEILQATPSKIAGSRRFCREIMDRFLGRLSE
ncbi:MAG TPA: type 1 glutamine amidotransferase [Methanoregulaceae archaeon]|nr:type 1 glutamine amidotransferase [Methanoregulaceae archaeon]